MDAPGNPPLFLLGPSEDVLTLGDHDRPGLDTGGLSIHPR